MKVENYLLQIEKLHKAIYTGCEIDFLNRASLDWTFSQRAKNVSFMLYSKAMKIHFSEMGFDSGIEIDASTTPEEIYENIIKLLKSILKIVISLEFATNKIDRLERLAKENLL